MPALHMRLPPLLQPMAERQGGHSPTSNPSHSNLYVNNLPPNTSEEQVCRSVTPAHSHTFAHTLRHIALDPAACTHLHMFVCLPAIAAVQIDPQKYVGPAVAPGVLMPTATSCSSPGAVSQPAEQAWPSPAGYMSRHTVYRAVRAAATAVNALFIHCRRPTRRLRRCLPPMGRWCRCAWSGRLAWAPLPRRLLS